MNDYISRQTVLRCIKESRNGIDWGQSEDGDAFLHYSAALYRTVASKECVPAADVAPVVHSTWIENGDPLMLTCGNCGYGVMRYNNTRFCPNCCAKMDGGKS